MYWPLYSHCLLALAFSFSLFGFPAPVHAAESERPNIVFILADDLGYGDLGCYGADDISTPHLDQLAREGMRFTDFYANAAVCSPTRMAFLTGRYQQRFGLDNALTYQEMGRGLPIPGETLANRLKSAGYVTGLSGKWHVGYDRGRQPLQQGFDHFFGLLGGNHHYFEHMDRIGVPDLWFGNEAIDREGYSTDLITKDALIFIEKNQSHPFFLFLSHAAPHFPWQGPEDAERLVEPKKKSWQTGDRETYFAMVERMDEGIGEVLALLDSLDLKKRTLVVFTSDNGGSTYSRNAPLQGGKSSLWEGGIRVPCIARWPRKIEAGAVSGQLGITMDWTATFLGLAGEDAVQEDADGIDLLPTLTGEREEVERTLFWRRKIGPRRKGFEEGRSVRRGKWKLTESAESGPALFDLDSDSGETTNLVDQHEALVSELSALLDKWEEEVDRSHAAAAR
jgi:arylsulfatase A-like enzyme